MSVIRTDQWLEQSYQNPNELCKKLISYFEHATSHEIYQYLLLYGIYRPIRNGEKVVTELCNRQFWKIVEDEYNRLKEKWSGPEIPIFIFPSNTMNREISRLYHGKSGLAFYDKLFLFVSSENDDQEIKALLTHEYNHVCRLDKDRKKESDYTLLDSVVLEGMAESAVKENYGEPFMAPWTTLYTRNQAINMWKKFIEPNHTLKKSTKNHHELLYGTKLLYPKMCGYSTGYHIVQQCIEKSHLSTKELLAYPAEKILKISRFEI